MKNFCLLVLVITALLNPVVSHSHIYKYGKVNPKNIEYVIVRSTYFTRTNTYKPNSVLLINDKKEITIILKLANNNKLKYEDACGHQFTAEFCNNRGEILMELMFREDNCDEYIKNNDEIQFLIDGFLKAISVNTGYYQHWVKIPVSITPDSIAKVLKKKMFLFHFSKVKGGITQQYRFLYNLKIWIF